MSPTEIITLASLAFMLFVQVGIFAYLLGKYHNRISNLEKDMQDNKKSSTDKFSLIFERLDNIANKLSEIVGRLSKDK